MSDQTKVLSLAELEKVYASRAEELLADLFKYLEFETISVFDSKQSELIACAKWLKSYCTNAGLKTSIIDTTQHPVVLAEWMGAGDDKPTLLFYGHYDVQPADPLDLWNTPPFTPTLINNKVFARGAQDNKGQSFFTIAAICSLLQEYGSLPVNVKILLEGDEEHGSGGLSDILDSLRDLVSADYLFVVDVGFISPDKPSVTLGARGITALSLEITGSYADLHSGIHGGIVYNPLHALVAMLASLRNEQGAITVPGFYDNVVELDPVLRKQIDLDFDLETYRRQFGAEPIGGELAYQPMESRGLRPTLEVNGISGGFSGEGFKTVIPAKAGAKLSARLVPEQDPVTVSRAITCHLQSKLPPGLSLSITTHPGGGKAFLTSPETKAVELASKATSEVTGRKCGFILEGGSIPIVPALTKCSGAEVVLIGYGLPEDNIHSPNESFSLDRFRSGFITICRILSMCAED